MDVAEDGEDALRQLHSRRYDLLLTDCHMPRMDGVALARAARSDPDPAVRTIPIIGVTADVTEAQQARCLEAGMNEVAIKPVTLERLRLLVIKHLQAAEAARHAVAPGGGSGVHVV